MTSIQIDIKDGLSSSTAIKGPCRVATTANITLSGEQTIDGVAVVTDDRVLVKNQSAASDNGIWVCDTGAWRRSKDFNKAKDIKTGTMVNVTGGAVGSGWWQVSTTGDVTVGTTSIDFSQAALPFDSDLAAIAALATTPYGRSLLTMAAAENVRDSIDAAPYVATRTAMKALDTTKDTSANLTEAGREGSFLWKSGDYSAQIAADTLEGVYVKATAVAATSGAWVRQFTGYARDIWWGTTHLNVADDSAALQAAIDVCQAFDFPLKLFYRGNYKVNTGLTAKHGQNSTDTKKYHFHLAGNDAQLLPAAGITALSIVPRCTLADNATGRGEAFIDIENLTIYGNASATAKALVIGAAGMWCSNIGNNRLHNVVAQSFGSTGSVSFIECRKWRVASLECRSSTLLIQATTSGSIVGDLEFDFLEITGSTEALPGMKINATAASGLPQARGVVFNRCIFYACGYEMRSSTSGLLGDIWFNACQWDSGPVGAGNIAMLVATGAGGKINGIHFNQPYIVNYTAEALKVQASNVGEITDVNVVGAQIGTITPDTTGFNAAVTFIKVQNYRIIGTGFTGMVAGDTGSSFIRSFLCSDFVISDSTASGSVSMTRGIQIDGGNTNYKIFGNSLDVSVAAQQVIDTDLAASRHVFGNRGDPYLAASEGTATPTIVGTTTAGAGTYTSQSLTWWRLGKLVHFVCTMSWTAHTGTGNISIVPGTGGPPSAAVQTPLSFEYSSLDYTSPPQAHITAGSNTIGLQMAATGGVAAGLPIEAAATLRIAGSYLTS